MPGAQGDKGKALQKPHAPDAWDSWAGPDDAANYKTLNRQEAAAWRARNPQVSPWRVVAFQAVVGGVMSLLAWLFTQSSAVSWSVLYGASAAVVPGALMARGLTSRLSNVSVGGGVVSFMLWEFVKIGVSVVMLALADRIVQPLSWPAMLGALVVCLNVYLLALLWRPRAAEQQSI
jgi:ATP synthase protein I